MEGSETLMPWNGLTLAHYVGYATKLAPMGSHGALPGKCILGRLLL